MYVCIQTHIQIYIYIYIYADWVCLAIYCFNGFSVCVSEWHCINSSNHYSIPVYVFSYLLPAIIYFLEKICLWPDKEAEADKGTFRKNNMCEWVWTNFPFMLIQEKSFVQLKYMCYNAVSQMYSRSRTLMDRDYALLCFMFIRCDLYFYSLQDSRWRDNWLWLLQ